MDIQNLNKFTQQTEKRLINSTSLLIYLHKHKMIKSI